MAPTETNFESEPQLAFDPMAHSDSSNSNGEPENPEPVTVTTSPSASSVDGESKIIGFPVEGAAAALEVGTTKRTTKETRKPIRHRFTRASPPLDRSLTRMT